MTNFSKNLKKLRVEKEISQEDLGKILNLSKSTISLYESGKREPDFKTLEMFADFFNVTTDYILGRESKNSPDFSYVFEASSLGDAIVRIVNICAEFNLSNDVMFEMIRKARDKYGFPGGAGGVAAHGPSYPGSGVLDDED